MSHFEKISTLASRLQGRAYQLSSDGREGSLKQDLRHAAHALDSSVVLVRRQGLRLVVQNARGFQRRLTFREAIGYVVLGRRTEIRP
mgnify:CR=1 FL=1